mmetsp:Transcript_4042/g.2990  ORF Transcript_4042/g.2990 Transcript_4042/m.2990 type:complete len:189 (-) Transcript_4042:276-842(-)
MNMHFITQEVLRHHFHLRQPDAGASEEEEALEFFEEDAVVWIDPLDGTHAYTKGNLDAVTILIGVAFKGRPRFGIIHKPFFSNQSGLSRTYFGSVECGAFKTDIEEHMDREIMYELARPAQYLPPFESSPIPSKDSFSVQTLCTKNRFKQMQEVLEQISPSVNIRVGGAGNKGIVLLEGQADVLVHVV